MVTLLTSKACSEPDSAIAGLDLDKEGTQDVDAPARARGPVFLPPWARGWDWGVNQPLCSVRCRSRTDYRG